MFQEFVKSLVTSAAGMIPFLAKGITSNKDNNEMIRHAKRHATLWPSAVGVRDIVDTSHRPIAYTPAVEDFFVAYSSSSNAGNDGISFVVLGEQYSGKTFAACALTDRHSQFLPKRALTFNLNVCVDADTVYSTILSLAGVPDSATTFEQQAHAILAPLLEEPKSAVEATASKTVAQALERGKNRATKAARLVGSQLEETHDSVCGRGVEGVLDSSNVSPAGPVSLPDEPSSSASTAASSEDNEETKHEFGSLIGDTSELKLLEYSGDHRPVLVFNDFNAPLGSGKLHCLANALVTCANLYRVTMFFLTTSQLVACQLVSINGGVKIAPLPALSEKHGHWLDGLSDEDKAVIKKRIKDREGNELVTDFGWKRFDVEDDVKRDLMALLFRDDHRVTDEMIKQHVAEGGSIGKIQLAIEQKVAALEKK